MNGFNFIRLSESETSVSNHALPLVLIFILALGLWAEVGWQHRQTSRLRQSYLQHLRAWTLQQKQHQSVDFQQPQLAWAQLLGQLASLLPKGVYLERLTLQSQTLHLQGRADSMVVITQIVRVLNQLPWLSHGRILEATTQNSAPIRFQLQFEVTFK
ncbi:PilN domain-containing protein [Celerinatantimonas sp. YJH-8]|uniref:PilN domain-containing protein n=1 Tax=Celerinatantimonas sp. YJH-8 TaxID=3228714 RepID=UPI0038BE9BF6